MAVREGRDQAKVSAILDGVSLAALDRATYRSAGLSPMQNLRTLDALHLEAAIRLDVDAVLTYDHRLGEAAKSAGIDFIAPGESTAAVIRVRRVPASCPDQGRHLRLLGLRCCFARRELDIGRVSDSITTSGASCDHDGGMTIDLERAQSFMTAHARVLDRRRFDALLSDEEARRDAIIAALDAYRNADGGYGWGLEPDLRAPESQPAAALHAFEALVAAGPRTSPHVVALLDWLDRASLDDGGLPFALPIAEASGCAPFWSAPDPTESSLQITAAVAAQAHRAANHDVRIGSHPWLARATRYCFNRIREVEAQPFAYVLSFSLQLLDVLARDDAEARDLLAHLARFIPADGALSVDGGAEGESVHLASEPGMPLNRLLGPQVVARELDRLTRAQQPDGGWPVDFDSYSPAATLEWRGYATANAIATLRAHGRI